MNIVMIGSIEHDGMGMEKLANKLHDVLPIFNNPERKIRVIYPKERDSEKERLIDARISYVGYISRADVVVAFPKKIFIEEIHPETESVKYAFGESTTYELAMAFEYCDLVLVMNAVGELETLNLNSIVDIDYVIPDKEEMKRQRESRLNNLVLPFDTGWDDSSPFKYGDRWLSY